MKLHRNNKWMAAALSALMLTSVNAAEHDDAAARNRTNEGTRHDEDGGYINADFIYWSCHQEGLSYQFNNQTVGGVAGNNEILDITKSGAAKPGFKVALGMNTPHDNWGVYAQYTWLWFDSSDNQIKQDATNGQTCTWSDDTATSQSTYVANGHALWRMKFNDVFLSLKRSVYKHAKTHFQAEFGLQGTWNDQTVEVVESSTAAAQADRHTAKQEFGSIGWRGASDFTWSFTEDNAFSFYSDFALSILAAKWDNKRWKDTGGAEGAALTDANLQAKATTYGLQPVVDFNAGLRWQTTLDSAENENYGFMVQAGWENQYWQGHSRIINYSAVEAFPHDGSLSFSGLSLRAQFNW